MEEKLVNLVVANFATTTRNIKMKLIILKQ